jgi:hypothetical protein
MGLICFGSKIYKGKKFNSHMAKGMIGGGLHKETAGYQFSSRERLFSKMHLVNSPNCMVCGVKESNTHIFTECLMVREAWGWVRMRMLELLPEENARCSNFEMINLMFEQHVLDLEAVWLVATYLEFVWMEKLKRNRIVKIEHTIGHLKLRYKANQVSKRPKLGFMSLIS